VTESAVYDEVADSGDANIPVQSLLFASTSAWVLDPSHGEFFDVAGPRRSEPVERPTRHGQMLRDLLGDSTGNPVDGQAWLLLDATNPKSLWLSADTDAALRAEQSVEDLAEWLRQPGNGLEESEEIRLGAARHRVFLDSERTRALGFTERSNVSVILDLRPRRIEAQLRCYVTTWVFHGSWPTDPGFCPPALRKEFPGAIRPDVDATHRLLYDVARNIETRLALSFVPVEFRGHWRRYGFPEFWFAIPSSIESDPSDYLVSAQDHPHRRDPSDRTGRRTNADRLAGLVITSLDIRDPSDPAIAGSVLNREFLVLRRIKREPTSDRWGEAASRWSDVPLYLTLPGERAVSNGNDSVFAKMALLVTELTDLEVGFSNDLYQLEADLEIWNHHTVLFNIVGERASTLWDALSTHLPARRHRSLARVHQAIELLHQLLMQALADLAHIEAIVALQAAEVDDAIDRIGDNFDRTFAERHVAADASVRHQLTRTYLYDRVHRFSREADKETKRVKTAYNDLISTIGAAFDERRVREVDVLNRSNVLFGFLAATIGLVIGLPRIVTIAPPFSVAADSILGRATVAVPIALIAFLLIFVLRVGVRWIGVIGRLGSWPFRRIYNGHGNSAGRSGVWGYLRDVSTANLEARAQQDTIDDTYDRKLAADFAALWDQASTLANFERGRTPRKDIGALARHVEEWGLHGLLLTERARRLHRYPVPTLTCLYVAIARTPRSFFDLAYLPKTDVVAHADFARSLMRLGFSWIETERLGEWLERPDPSARHALERVTTLGLKATMSPAERAAVMTIVDGSRSHLPGQRAASGPLPVAAHR